MKNDILFNIKFVRAIEKHDVLYNTRKIDYMNAAVLKETWEKIGQEMNETAQACKDRWKCIRTCYVRYVRLRTLNQKVRQYYLSKYLTFLLPFLKRDYGAAENPTLSQTDALFSEESNDGIDVDQGDVKIELVDTLFDGDSMSGAELSELQERLENDVPSEDELTVEEGSRRNEVKNGVQSALRTGLKRKMSDPLGIDDSVSYKSPCIETVDDSDLSFLRSLLPDMHRMSDQQKFEFKMKTMQIIGDILYPKQQ